MIPVSSGDVLGMTDERFGTLLAELNEKQQTMAMAVVLPGLVGVIAVVPAVTLGVTALLVGVALAAIAFAIGHVLDASRRSVVVFYELEPDAQTAYEQLTASFDRIAACAGKWHVDSGGLVRDLHTWKRNAGANHIIDKRPTTLIYALPRVLKANVTPPALSVGRETLYFLPDVVLVAEGEKLGAVAYDTLSIAYQDSRFIEEGSVPHDTQVVGQTWQHPNKSGGPDRRFASNRQIPICLYETLHLTSPNGLNELLQVSRNGVAAPLAAAAQQLVAATGKSSAQLALAAL